MEHGISWLNFIPGYYDLEHFVRLHTLGILGNEALVQHMIASVLVTALLLVFSLRVRSQLKAAGDVFVTHAPYMKYTEEADALLREVPVGFQEPVLVVLPSMKPNRAALLHQTHNCHSDHTIAPSKDPGRDTS